MKVSETLFVLSLVFVGVPLIGLLTVFLEVLRTMT